MNHLKNISLEELEKMKGDKKCYMCSICATSKEKILSGIEEIQFSKENVGRYVHLLFSNDPKIYVDKLEIIEVGNCAKGTNISEFKQDTIYVFKVGDPYLFNGTVKGVYSNEVRSVNDLYLVIQTAWGDILLVLINNFQDVIYLEIVPELTKISFQNFKKMAEGKRGYAALDLDYVGANFDPDFSLKQIENWDQIVISSDLNEFKTMAEIVPGNCTGETPLSNFIQNETHLFAAGDPYLFSGTVKGMIEELPYLIIETSWRDFVICLVRRGMVLHLEIKS